MTGEFVTANVQFIPEFFSDEDAPPIEHRRWWVNPANPDCPFNRYVGNSTAIDRLSRAAFAALGRKDRCSADVSFALLGPASTGKTTLAKMYAELLGIPFIEISPKSVKDSQDIVKKIDEVLTRTELQLTPEKYINLKLVPINSNESKLGPLFRPPPCVVFIDEVHALKNDVVQALLKATEPNDRFLDTGKALMDCKNICWMIATTDRGDLFDAFDTRFSKIFLKLYSPAEIAQIVRKVNPDWSEETCAIVSKFNNGIPREALAFAREMRLEAEYSETTDWNQIAAKVAKDNGYDEFGMMLQSVELLHNLAKQGPISKQRLSDLSSCKIVELEKFILPGLMHGTSERPALVNVSSRGVAISPAGLAELKKRGIAA